MKINNIIQGWKTYLKGETSEEAIKRSKACRECPEAVFGSYEVFMTDKTLKEVSGLKCNVCKCPLSTKLRSKNEKCPLNKW